MIIVSLVLRCGTKTFDCRFFGSRYRLCLTDNYLAFGVQGVSRVIQIFMLPQSVNRSNLALGTLSEAVPVFGVPRVLREIQYKKKMESYF